MNMIPVKSSNFSAIAYNRDTKVLTVRFNSGEKYEYLDVEYSKYIKLLEAISIGTYFHNCIRKDHQYRKVS